MGTGIRNSELRMNSSGAPRRYLAFPPEKRIGGIAAYLKSERRAPAPFSGKPRNVLPPPEKNNSPHWDAAVGEFLLHTQSKLFAQMIPFPTPL